MYAVDHDNLWRVLCCLSSVYRVFILVVGYTIKVFLYPTSGSRANSNPPYQRFVYLMLKTFSMSRRFRTTKGHLIWTWAEAVMSVSFSTGSSFVFGGKNKCYIWRKMLKNQSFYGHSSVMIHASSMKFVHPRTESIDWSTGGQECAVFSSPSPLHLKLRGIAMAYKEALSWYLAWDLHESEYNKMFQDFKSLILQKEKDHGIYSFSL